MAVTIHITIRGTQVITKHHIYQKKKIPPFELVTLINKSRRISLVTTTVFMSLAEFRIQIQSRSVLFVRGHIQIRTRDSQ